MSKSILIYDGECSFCRRWIVRWKCITGDRVEYLASQEVGERFPQIPIEDYERSVLLVDSDGNLFEGAEAVFRTLACVPGKTWPLWVYRNVPGFSLITEWGYQTVAKNREALGIFSSCIFGKKEDPVTFYLSRKIFLIILGIIYLFAFGSLWIQLDGIVGSRGILPAAEFLDSLRQQTDKELYFKIPTVFWFDASDRFLNEACIVGMVMAVALILGIAQGPVLFSLWFLYLSFVNVGQVFFAFQWDTLLLEVGFLAIFFTSWKLRLGINAEPPPSYFILWLFRFLLFRLIFSSGVMKWLSGDEAWRSLTALQFHYETQPLPTWIGWYMHQLPDAFHAISVVCLFFIQWVVPFFIFLPRRRHIACAVLVTHQFLIMLTGNYCFFNLLALGLCVLLMDDSFWFRILPSRFVAGFEAFGVRKKENFFKEWIARVAGVILLSLSVIYHLAPFYSRNFEPPKLVSDLYSIVKPFHLTSGYGLFAVMTTSRPEIIVEGSDDGVNWKDYEFKWKPGKLASAPAFIAPHQPRLDWQMWFAALGTYEQNVWFIRFAVKLLEGAKPVLKLIKHNPFPDNPPKYIRAVLYDYQFTSFLEWKKDTSFWKRKRSRLYLPPIHLS